MEKMLNTESTKSKNNLYQVYGSLSLPIFPITQTEVKFIASFGIRILQIWKAIFLKYCLVFFSLSLRWPFNNFLHTQWSSQSLILFFTSDHYEAFMPSHYNIWFELEQIICHFITSVVPPGFPCLLDLNLCPLDPISFLFNRANRVEV